MAWPFTAVATGDPVTARQMNGLPIKLAQTTIAATGTTAIWFTSIPRHYRHLYFHGYTRCASGGNTEYLLAECTFYDATVALASIQVLDVSGEIMGGASGGANGSLTGNYQAVCEVPAATAGGSLFGTWSVMFYNWREQGHGQRIWLSRYDYSYNNVAGVAVGSRSSIAHTTLPIWEIGFVHLDTNFEFSVGSKIALYGIP